MKNVARFKASLLSFLALAFVPALALADPTAGITFDPADTLATVASATAFITTVGLAVLGLIMVAKGIKWVRRAG